MTHKVRIDIGIKMILFLSLRLLMTVNVIDL